MTDSQDHRCGPRCLMVETVARAEADACVRAWHYSGKPYAKSRVHLGVTLHGRIVGAMQLGPAIDTRRVLSLVPGTTWDGYLELNRMALSDEAPRNSESRCLAIMARIIRKNAPHVEWIVSYSDATQCGDGAIYRAAGFLLTGCRPNSTLWRTPDGEIVSDVGIRTSDRLRERLGIDSGRRADFVAAGLSRLSGYQLRYMRFLTRSARKRLAVPAMSYSEIPDDARMYRGIACAGVAGPPEPPTEGVRPDPHAPHHQTAMWPSDRTSAAVAALPDDRRDPSVLRGQYGADGERRMREELAK